MSAWLLTIVSLIYLGVAVSYWRDGQKGLSLTFAAYALANVGLILAGKGK